MADPPAEQACSRHHARMVAALMAAREAQELWAAIDAERGFRGHCWVCRRGLGQLASAVVGAQGEMTCAECRAHWPGLGDAESGPEPARREALEARQHMARCPACREEYAYSVGISRLEEEGRLPEPEHYPLFDLAFLGRSAWQPAAAREAVRQLAAGIELRVKLLRRRASASFEGLAGWLLPRPEPASLGVRGKGGRSSDLVSLPDPEADLRIILAAQSARSGKANLTIEVRERASDTPLPQVRMTLHGSTGREVVEGRDGKATFVGLAPDRYVVEVRCATPRNGWQLWRLPVTIEQA